MKKQVQALLSWVLESSRERHIDQILTETNIRGERERERTEFGSTHLFKLKIKIPPLPRSLPRFLHLCPWYFSFSGLAARVEKFKPPRQSDLGFAFLLLKCTVASNEVLCLPGPQFPQQCRSRLSLRNRPALRQRDSLRQKRGAARIAAQASGCRLGTITRLRALSSGLGAGGEDRGSRGGAGKWGRDPHLSQAPRGSAPAARGLAAAGA